MNYRVVWTADATSDILELWTSSSDKAAVSAAARLIDRVLEQYPLDEKHEVIGGFGTAVRVPVGVDYRIDNDKRLVFVLAAWPITGD
jgi:plasmid stabilization system protein ParE